MYVPSMIGHYQSFHSLGIREQVGEPNTPNTHQIFIVGYRIFVESMDGRKVEINVPNLAHLLPYAHNGMMTRPCVWGFTDENEAYLLVMGSPEEQEAERGPPRANAHTLFGSICEDETGQMAQFIGSIHRYEVTENEELFARSERAYLLNGKVSFDFKPKFTHRIEKVDWEIETGEKRVYCYNGLATEIAFIPDDTGAMKMNNDLVYTEVDGVGVVFDLINYNGVYPYNERFHGSFTGPKGNVVFMLEGKVFHTFSPTYFVRKVGK